MQVIYISISIGAPFLMIEFPSISLAYLRDSLWSGVYQICDFKQIPKGNRNDTFL